MEQSNYLDKIDDLILFVSHKESARTKWEVVIDLLLWIGVNLFKDGKIHAPIYKWPMIIKKLKQFIKQINIS